MVDIHTPEEHLDLIKHYVTHAVPIRPQVGVLIASILVSILGSYATLLVLGRRTSPRGFRNMTLLLLAALCFAAVAVWGMHFVSMISIRLRPVEGEDWFITVS
jgi:NO-binding membrane sensor protein with MHYT domain